MLRYVDLEEDTETEGEGDGHEEPGDAEEDPAAQADTGHHVRVVWAGKGTAVQYRQYVYYSQFSITKKDDIEI